MIWPLHLLAAGLMLSLLSAFHYTGLPSFLSWLVMCLQYTPPHLVHTLTFLAETFVLPPLYTTCILFCCLTFINYSNFTSNFSVCPSTTCSIPPVFSFCCLTFITIQILPLLIIQILLISLVETFPVLLKLTCPIKKHHIHLSQSSFCSC